MNKKCLVMRGLPGSGKTHWIRELLACLGGLGYYDAIGFRIEAQVQDVKVVSADNYFMVPNSKNELVYQFDPAKLGEAHKDCMKQFLLAVGQGVGLVVVDNTNICAWEMSPYVSVATAFDYEVEIIQISAQIEDCIARNTHGVPAHVLGAMRESMLREFLPQHWRRWKSNHEQKYFWTSTNLSGLQRI